MGIKRNSKRLAASAIAIAGLAGGAMAVHADSLGQRMLALPAVAPAAWPAIPATTCATDESPDICDIDLFAGPSTVTVKDVTNPVGTQTVDILGFGVNIADPSQVTLAGGATSTIKVPADTAVRVHFSKDGSIANMPELSFPSLPAGSVTNSGDVYSFTTTTDMIGTSVFQPGSNADAPRQIAMGLVGVLIVTPVGCNTCAFGATSYNSEALVATTDLDLEFATNFHAGLHSFSMGYFGQSPNPDGTQRKVYHVINGQSFPDTAVIDAEAGKSVLLRYVNAGVTDKAIGLLGLRQTLLGRNASKYTDAQTFIAPLVGPGETADVAVDIPATAVAGQFYSLMDQGRQMNHGTASGFGGALTFIEVLPSIPPVIPPVDVIPVAATQEGGLPGGPLAPTTPAAQDPAITGSEGGQTAPPTSAVGSQGAPSGTPSEGGQPAQGTTGP